MAKEVGLTVRGQPSCQSQKCLSDVTVKLVIDYYCKNKVSWQAPGRKDCVIIHKLTDSGEKENNIKSVPPHVTERGISFV